MRVQTDSDMTVPQIRRFTLPKNEIIAAEYIVDVLFLVDDVATDCDKSAIVVYDIMYTVDAVAKIRQYRGRCSRVSLEVGAGLRSLLLGYVTFLL